MNTDSPQPIDLSNITQAAFQPATAVETVPAVQPAPAPRQVTPIRAGGALGAIIPQTFEEVFRIGRAVAAAGWAPKSYLVDPKNDTLGYSAEKISVAIMQGLEVGLSPMAALQSIAVINGMPSLWGDGALAVVRASGWLVSLTEEPMVELVPADKGKPETQKLVGYRCTAIRRGDPNPIVRQFTLDDASAAGLTDKAGPWKLYRGRMMMMRARAWVLRDGFADVLKGLSIAEEAMDIPHTVTVAASKPGKAADQRSALDAFSGAQEGGGA